MQCVLPNQSEYTFTCETNTAFLIWSEGSNHVAFSILFNPSVQLQLGSFITLRLTIDGTDLISTATVNISSLAITSLTIICDENTNNGVEASLINGGLKL